MTIRLGIPPSCQHDAITGYGNKANRAGWPRFALLFGSISMDAPYTFRFEFEERNEWIWAPELLVNALLPRENNAEGKLAGECLLLLMDCPPLKYTSWAQRSRRQHLDPERNTNGHEKKRGNGTEKGNWRDNELVQKMQRLGTCISLFQ